MLKLVNVVKTYVMGDSKVEALKGISVNFRKNEFVSILGPSGCGKTTTMKRLSAEFAVHCSQTFRHGFQTFGSILQWSAVGSKTLQTHFRLLMQ